MATESLDLERDIMADRRGFLDQEQGAAGEYGNTMATNLMLMPEAEGNNPTEEERRVFSIDTALNVLGTGNANPVEVITTAAAIERYLLTGEVPERDPRQDAPYEPGTGPLPTDAPDPDGQGPDDL